MFTEASMVSQWRFESFPLQCAFDKHTGRYVCLNSYKLELMKVLFSHITVKLSKITYKIDIWKGYEVNICHWHVSKFMFTLIKTNNNRQSNLITKSMVIKETWRTHCITIFFFKSLFESFIRKHTYTQSFKVKHLDMSKNFYFSWKL